MLTQWNTRAQNRKFVASYSGGKDSSLALYQAMQMGKPVALIVMLEEQGLKSRSHGMSLDIIHAQAKAIGLPIYSASATWQDYQSQFIQLLQKTQALGAETLPTAVSNFPGVDKINTSAEYGISN